MKAAKQRVERKPWRQESMRILHRNGLYKSLRKLERQKGMIRNPEIECGC